MNCRLTCVVRLTLVVAIVIAGALPVAAQGSSGAVSLAVAGQFARGGEFAGTATINRFEQRGTEIVAVGLVRGTLVRGDRTVGSVLTGEVTWPVVLRVGGVSAVKGTTPSPVRIEPVRWTLAQEICPILQLSLGPVDLNLLGLSVTLDPIALDLHGEMGTPLGDLVCAVSDLLGNIAGLVKLLNTILGLITGLLGGIGGVLP